MTATNHVFRRLLGPLLLALSACAPVPFAASPDATPFTGYVAQFHALGDATQSPCASGGAVLGDQGSQSVIGNTTVNSDGSGGLIIRGLSSTAGVTAAQYVELHEAGNPATVPLCADLTVKPAKQ